jgi:dimeric dUTPase (all-alpha-NTP-PPase superfamily)
MFEEQKKLDEHIRSVKVEQGLKFEFNEQEWTDKLTTAIIEEAIEVKRFSNWKWWKKPKPLDKEEIKEELADILHFWLSLCLKLGFSPKEMFETYMRKNRENFERQNKGY